MGYHVATYHDTAGETPEAIISELSQSYSPVAVSLVHITEETVVEADDTCLAIVQTYTNRLTVPLTFVTIHGHCSSVWVVNPHLKPWNVHPDTVLLRFVPGTRGGTSPRHHNGL